MFIFRVLAIILFTLRADHLLSPDQSYASCRRQYINQFGVSLLAYPSVRALTDAKFFIASSASTNVSSKISRGQRDASKSRNVVLPEGQPKTVYFTH